MSPPLGSLAVVAIGGAEIVFVFAALLMALVVLAAIVVLIYFVVRAATKPAAEVPPTLPPEVAMQNQQRRDREQMKLLAIFHFVFAGLALLGIGFLCAHYFFMHTIFSNPDMWKGQKGGPPPKVFLDVFIWFYLFMGLILLTGLVLNLLSGVFLQQRKHRLFSMVIGGLNCAQVPIGTILGIFTIIVLSRESVRQLYSDNAPT